MSSLQSASAGRASAASSLTTRKDLKFMWVRTQAKEVFTAALEAGVQHFVFDQAAQSMLSDWRKIASVPHVLLDAGEASATSAHCRGIVDEVASFLAALLCLQTEPLFSCNAVPPCNVHHDRPALHAVHCRHQKFH